MLILIVHFTVKTGAEKQTLEIMCKMEEHTRREPGNRMYVGQQSTENPRKFCFYEQYVDQAALDAHRAAPYFKQYVTDRLGPLIENITREFFRPVEEI
jgi:(4S)-4-hydroxy-5-phosphonooxypentane-2,3-dione isomerase